MERVILRASEGMVFTDGVSGGRTVYLAEGQTAEGWHEVPEDVFIRALEAGLLAGEAMQADYEAALREFGVNI